MALSSGDRAPDFELAGVRDGERSTYRLSDLRGAPVVLVFYPGDSTPVCTRQLNSYSKDVAQFEELDAQILAISPQGLDSHEDFATEQNGFYRRCVFVVDGAGLVTYVHRGFAGATFRRSEELLAAIRSTV